MISISKESSMSIKIAIKIFLEKSNTINNTIRGVFEYVRVLFKIVNVVIYDL